MLDFLTGVLIFAIQLILAAQVIAGFAG